MRTLCLVLMLSQSVYALAPPPVDFVREEVIVDKKKYVVTFDGEKVEMHEEVTTLRPEIVFFFFVAGGIFWVWFIGYVTGWW